MLYPEVKELLIKSVSKLLYDNYQVGKDNVKGQSATFLRNELRYKGWSLPAGTVNFETLLEDIGFKIVDAKNNRNQKTRVVINYE